jgi:hypothetical protein
MSGFRLRSHNRTGSIRLPSLEKMIIAVSAFLAGSMSTLVFGFHGACHVSPSSPLLTRDENRVEELVKKRLSQGKERNK